jgi:peptide/nickel transport system substrate-binding protein
MSAVALAVIGSLSLTSVAANGVARVPHAASGTLTIASQITSSSLNPALSPTAVPENWFTDLDYEPFIIHNTSGGFTPGLATTWGYVGTNNEQFVINLRPNVQFSDGTTLTAAGAVTDLNYYLSAGEGGVDAFGSAATITATGPLTVQISLAAPNSEMPYELSQNGFGKVISPKALATPAGIAALGSSSAGAGPYELDASATIANSSYVYVQNPNYYDPSAQYYSKVIIEIITSPSAELAALETGQIQVMQGETQLVSTAKSDGLTVLTAPGTNGPIYLAINASKKGPLSNVKVRQALEYAVDRPLISKALFGTYATPDEEFEGPGDTGYVASLAKHYTYDPTLAKKLLKEAGYPHGFTSAANCSPQLDLAQICEAVQADWAKIGVKLNVSSPTQDVWITNALSGKYPITGIGAFESGIAAQTRDAYVPGFLDSYAIPGEASAFTAASAASVGSVSATSLWAKLQKIEVLAATNIVVASPNLLMFTSKSVKGVNFSTGQPVPYPPLFQPAS